MLIKLPKVKPAKSNFLRLFRCIFRQGSKLKWCPPITNLAGVNILITGGDAGIGEFISRELVKAGANVISLSRGISKGKQANVDVHSLQCDLAKPENIIDAIFELGDRKFDIIICNSGIVQDTYEQTATGIEKTFAVNVLGHHLLYRLLIKHNMLNKQARIVLTSGEAYVSATDCLVDRNRDKYKGFEAYGSSKLGNMWQVLELTKHYPNIKSFAIHPGVIASGFAGTKKTGFLHSIREKLFISEQAGAQAALIAATQDLPNGSYWHNAYGLIDLPKGDIAKDANKSSALWQQLESLVKPWL